MKENENEKRKEAESMHQEQVSINTPCGRLLGIDEEGVHKFLGIRYATAGRWEYPQEVTGWEGTYEAVRFGAAPIQKRTYMEVGGKEKSEHYEREFMSGVKSEYSEDCLFLNVWTPRDAQNCPVLIVLYGGGLLSGQTDELELDGSNLARRGVVVVTLNYRVNIFGFLAMKELAEEYGKSGNYGYYDQQMAIQWVRHNIHAFGGDVSRMTIIGQSAGAASAETQIKSPLNEGVFQGAIIQSSAGFSTMIKAKDDRQKVYAMWHEVYMQSGCSTVKEFKNMPTKELFELFERVSAKNPIAYASAIYDENFTGEAKNKPCKTNIICSVTSEDVAPIVLYVLCRALAKSQRGKADTYGYYFSRQLPGDDLGAWHSSDLWYTYGNLKKCWRPFEEEDMALSDRMMTYFVNFIKTGNPNAEGLEEWKPLTKKEKRFMMFDIGACRMGKPSLGKLLKNTIFKKGPGIGL